MSGVVDMFSYMINGAPSSPPAPTPTTPKKTDAEVQAELDAQTQAEQASLDRGRTSTYLTGGQGLTDMGSTKKTLFGQ